MSTVTHPAASPRLEAERTPPLCNGDRLTADEFLRRYEAMPDCENAQLIEGVVYIMSSPVSHVNHSNPHFNLIGWLSLYASATPGVEGGDNGTLRLDMRNVPQPDAYLIVLPSHGGQAQMEGDYIRGAPELVAEVSATTVSIDLHAKRNAYRRNGVREYVVWRVFDEEIDWFVLRAGKYARLALAPEGCYKSEILPGLWLDAAALIRGDMSTAARVAQQGLASTEHPEFVARLNQTAAQTSS